jgi:lipopolysaccharide heptosyltransferase II
MAKEQRKRILIFNVNWLGDVLFSTAVFRNVRRNYPGSFIACAVPSRCYSVLKGNPHLDEVIIYDEKDRHKGLLAQLNFVKTLKSKNFDVVFLLHRSFTRALACRLAGIPERIGYCTRKRGFLLTKKIPPADREGMHRIDYYLNVIEKAGLKVEDRYPEFFVGEDDIKFVENILHKNSIDKDSFLVVINPGGNWLPKRWPKDYWALLADRMILELSAKVVITGNSNDLPLAMKIKEGMKEIPAVVCGIFNLKQLGALAQRADFFITADTGPLHIANASGSRRIVALFGPTDPAITGPFPLKNVSVLQESTGCRIPCYLATCQDNRCMKAITPEKVMKLIKSLKG